MLAPTFAMGARIAPEFRPMPSVWSTEHDGHVSNRGLIESPILPPRKCRLVVLAVVTRLAVDHDAVAGRGVLPDTFERAEHAAVNQQAVGRETCAVDEKIMHRRV